MSVETLPPHRFGLKEWLNSLSYLIICLPTKYVSWFNIWANALGIIILSGFLRYRCACSCSHTIRAVVLTILLPVKAETLNSGKAIFTQARLFKFSTMNALLICLLVGLQPVRLACRMVFVRPPSQGFLERRWS